MQSVTFAPLTMRHALPRWLARAAAVLFAIGAAGSWLDIAWAQAVFRYAYGGVILPLGAVDLIWLVCDARHMGRFDDAFSGTISRDDDPTDFAVRLFGYWFVAGVLTLFAAMLLFGHGPMTFGVRL